MSIDEKMRARIQALLAKAQSTAHEEEAATYFAKATELMDKYRLTIEQVRPAGTGPTYGTRMFFLGDHRNLRATLSLLVKVAKHYGVVVLTPSTGNSKYPDLVGTADDLEAVLMMFSSLILQRDRFCLGTPVPPWAKTVTFRNSFCYGFAYRVGQRLEEIRARQVQVADGNSTALALYDRHAAVMKYLEQDVFGEPVKSNSRNDPNLSSAGVNAGIEAGNRTDLGQDRMTAAAGRLALEA